MLIILELWKKRNENTGLDLGTMVNQRREFGVKVPNTKFDTSVLENEVRELKEWQMSQETQKVDIRTLVDGTLEFVETLTKKGKVTTNRYQVKKDRI